MKDSFIQVKHLTKVFPGGDGEVRALGDVSFCVKKGSFATILGPSGSGKTTLFNILACLDVPSSGSVRIGETETTALNDRQRTLFRRNVIGIVFQFYNLLADMTAIENIRLGSKVKGDCLDENDVAKRLGITHLLNRFPHQLSGGQQQKVAIARALVKNPDIILCDEPTSALDSSSTSDFLDIIKASNKEFGKTVLLITHNADVANCANQKIVLKDGQIEACI
ncbi:MAG: ABC transporter ATP-binding protein [Coriobacteriales bacterium]|jgi:putative ABC transport system ATP-binding protein|nr:ABC transporter ATP-binding protein [Coriobacteriales bacterium]